MLSAPEICGVCRELYDIEYLSSSMYDITVEGHLDAQKPDQTHPTTTVAVSPLRRLRQPTRDDPETKLHNLNYCNLTRFIRISCLVYPACIPSQAGRVHDRGAIYTCVLHGRECGAPGMPWGRQLPMIIRYRALFLIALCCSAQSAIRCKDSSHQVNRPHTRHLQTSW